MVIDIIFAVSFVVALIVGLIQGLWKQLFKLVGILLVAFLTANLYKYPAGWLAGVIESQLLRTVIGAVATFGVLIAIYSVITHFILKAINSIKVFSVLDKILGVVLGVGILYTAFALVAALILNTDPNFLSWTKSWIEPQFLNSWVINNIYKNNFLGDYIIGKMGLI